MDAEALIYLPHTDSYALAEELEPTYDISTAQLSGYLATINGYPHWTSLQNVHLFQDVPAT